VHLECAYLSHGGTGRTGKFDLETTGPAGGPVIKRRDNYSAKKTSHEVEHGKEQRQHSATFARHNADNQNDRGDNERNSPVKAAQDNARAAGGDISELSFHGYF
jgi:hypothetical protein